MNDPWLPLIAALSGKRTTSPATWPSRKVYRIEGYVTDAAAQARRLEAQARRTGMPTPAAR